MNKAASVHLLTWCQFGSIKRYVQYDIVGITSINTSFSAAFRFLRIEDDNQLHLDAREIPPRCQLNEPILVYFGEFSCFFPGQSFCSRTRIKPYLLATVLACKN